MSIPSDTDRLLTDRIRAGEERAWDQLIAQYEGRLLAYVESRLHDRSSAEDVVQETFIGFLTSLPNYDRRRPLESYLFSIAAHKLTDRLRRDGRRPALPLATADSSNCWEPVANVRAASSLARSGERRGLEDAALTTAIRQQIEYWRRRGQWEKLRCVELLFVRGQANKDVAEKLAISEQTVANYKHEFLAKLQDAVHKQCLPKDVFPELSRG